MKNKKTLLVVLMILSFLISIFFSPTEKFAENPWSYLMSMSWIIWIIFLSWQTILGIRPIWKFFSNDFFFINSVHKRLGIWTTFFLILHPVASVIAREQNWTYAFLPDFSTNSNFWITMWRLAFDLIFVILFTKFVLVGKSAVRAHSTFHFEAAKYDYWKHFH